MSDDPKKRGAADRSKVSQQPYEIDYLARKHGVPSETVRKVQRQVGPSRPAVEKELKRRHHH